MLANLGRNEEAESALRSAVASSHAGAAPHAAVQLGDLLQECGRLQEAADAYRIAISSDYAAVVPEAFVKLGIQLATEGGEPEA